MEHLTTEEIKRIINLTQKSLGDSEYLDEYTDPEPDEIELITSIINAYLTVKRDNTKKYH